MYLIKENNKINPIVKNINKMKPSTLAIPLICKLIFANNSASLLIIEQEL